MHEIDNFEKLAKTKLSKNSYEYFARGAVDEISLQENRNAFDTIFLTPRILKEIDIPDMTSTIFKETISMPIIIAPMSYQGLAGHDAENTTARAARSAKIIMTLSTMSNKSLESVSSENPELLWFQLYILNDRLLTLELVKRAEASNYKAIVVTVDSQVLGIRKNTFMLPSDLKLGNFPEDETFISQFKKIDLFDKKISWKDIEWLKSNTKLPIIIKGILNIEDAKIAIENQIEGIIISNHGGRQLDTCISPIRILPYIAEIASNKSLIFIDSGIRRGTDILKSIALGADAVLIGRPILWGLAANGFDGITRVLEILRHELNAAMALSGFSSIQQLRNNGHEIIYENK